MVPCTERRRRDSLQQESQKMLFQIPMQAEDGGKLETIRWKSSLLQSYRGERQRSVTAEWADQAINFADGLSSASFRQRIYWKIGDYGRRSSFREARREFSHYQSPNQRVNRFVQEVVDQKILRQSSHRFCK